MKRVFFIALFLILTGVTSFGQQGEGKLDPRKQKIADELQYIQDHTNWGNPEEAQKAFIRMGKLAEQSDNDKSIPTEKFPIDTTKQKVLEMGAEEAGLLAQEIGSDFKNEDGTGEISDEYYQETTFLMIDLENPKPGLTLDKVKSLSKIETLFIAGTESGVEINLDSLFVHLEGKPLTELFLVRNYSGTKTIPESIGKLTGLKKLGLYANEIADLPNSIKNLTDLEELYLDVNPIEKLPASVGQLKSLKMLGIVKTGISPEEQSLIQKMIPNCQILSK